MRIRRLCAVMLLVWPTVAGVSCKSDSTETPQDRGVQLTLDQNSQLLAQLCDDSPIIDDAGYAITYGCRFLHHCYKIKHSGRAVVGDLDVCGAGGYCFHRLVNVCERWLLIDDGQIDIIVNQETGAVATHNRYHGTGVDLLPKSLQVPISIVPHRLDGGPGKDKNRE